MLEHIIEATTFPGDIVLDCFAGSGSTAAATLRLGRRAVAVEIEPQWIAHISSRLEIFTQATICPTTAMIYSLKNSETASLSFD